MYLSRVQLNRQRRGAWRLMSNPQRLHAAVLSSFPDPPTGPREGEPRVLWRLDLEPDDRVFLYVVSPDRPDFAHLAEQAGWPSTERGSSREYQPFLDRLSVGQCWAFRLTANPTQYLQPESSERAKRVGLSIDRQKEWLVRRGEAVGFRLATAAPPGAAGEISIPVLSVTRRTISQFSRRGATGPVTLAIAQFDGVLEVTDADALRRTLVTGIGPAKAYGCGLLTLAPLASP